MTTSPSRRYYAPTRPYDALAAINRIAVGQGSVPYARAGADASYNGHHVTVGYNEIRGYWIAEYWWSGRCVLARGGFAECVDAAMDEHRRGALGARVDVYCRSDEDVAVAAATPGLVPWSDDDEKARYATWRTWRHQRAAEACRRGEAGIELLLGAATEAEFDAKLYPRLAARGHAGMTVFELLVSLALFFGIFAVALYYYSDGLSGNPCEGLGARYDRRCTGYFVRPR